MKLASYAPISICFFFFVVVILAYTILTFEIISISISWGLDLTQNLTKKFDVACFETHISIGDVSKILLYTNNALLNYTGYG